MDDRLAKEAFVDDMLDQVGKFDLASIPKTWRKMTGNPLGSALATGAAVALPAYFMARPMASGLTNLKGRLLRQSPEQIQAELAKVNNAGDFRGRLATILGLLAAGGSLAHNYVPKSVQPDSGGLKSLLTWDHKWPDDGTMSPDEFNKRKDAIPKIPPNYLQKQQMAKEAGYNAAYMNPLHDHPGIPVDYSLDLIWGDKYLNGKEKINASKPFENAGEGKSGMISTGDLARGALRAGFGAGAGYLLANTMGKVLSAPQAVTQTLSATGALAGMLKNTGVI